MGIVFLLVLTIGVFVMTRVLIRLITHGYARKSGGFCPIESATAFVLSAVCFAASLYYAWHQNVILSAGFLFLLLLAFIYADIRFDGWKHGLLSLVLCLMAVFMLPSSLPLFSIAPAPVVYLFLAVCMWVIIRVFTFLDRTVWLSFLSIFGQVFLLVLVAFAGFLPPKICFSVYAVGVATWAAILSMQAWTGQAVLGRYGALVIGFTLGFLWTYFIAFELYAVPLILFSSGIFQIVWALIATFAVTRHFWPIEEPLLFEQAWDTGIKSKRLLYYMLFSYMILSLLAFAVMTGRFQNSAGSWVIVTFVLVDMVLRLRKWGASSPSIREVTGDLKTGFSVLFQEMKQVPLKSDKEQLSPDRKKTGKKRKK